jgi:hypothetical protein
MFEATNNWVSVKLYVVQSKSVSWRGRFCVFGRFYARDKTITIPDFGIVIVLYPMFVFLFCLQGHVDVLERFDCVASRDVVLVVFDVGTVTSCPDAMSGRFLRPGVNLHSSICV